MSFSRKMKRNNLAQLAAKAKQKEQYSGINVVKQNRRDEEIMQMLMAEQWMLAWVLHDKFGFGKQRLTTAITEFVKLCNSFLEDKSMNIKQLQDVLKEETGFDLNDIIV